MTERRLTTWLVIAVIGFIAQFVDGTLGMGYGVFSSSLLVAAGLLPAIASASVHTAEIVTTLISGIAHHGFGNVEKNLLLPLVIPGVLGGIGGAVFLSNVPGNLIKPWVAGILLIMGCIIVWRFVAGNARARGKAQDANPNCEAEPAIRSEAYGDPARVLSTGKIALIGFIAAAFDAFGGGGWGPITTPTLILSHNVSPHKVVGSVNMAEFFVTLAISMTFFITIGPEQFDWPIVISLLIGGMIAAPLAAWICRKLPQRWLGILIGILLILTNLRTIILSVL